jgi:hypothetical protein
MDIQIPRGWPENIAHTEVHLTVVAKTCGCKDKYTRKVTYTFIDAYHGPCLIKKDIILAELDLMRETFEIY